MKRYGSRSIVVTAGCTAYLTKPIKQGAVAGDQGLLGDGDGP